MRFNLKFSDLDKTQQSDMVLLAEEHGLQPWEIEEAEIGNNHASR